MQKEVVAGAIFLLLSCVVPGALAIGVSSSREPIPIAVGESIPFTFTLVNSKSEEVNASVALDGDLKEYIKLPVRDFTLKPGERVTVTATAFFPRGFAGKGRNIILIIATDETNTQAQIMARTHSVIERQFIFAEEPKTTIVKKELPVYELPPRTASLNPSIAIGDFFRIGVNAVQGKPITIFLIAIAVLLVVFNIQLRIQRRKEKRRIIEDILKR